jgi:RND superfamily putative drug exporter
MMKYLARFCYARRRLIVIGWVLLLVGLFALSFGFGGEPKTEFRLPGSESQKAVDLLEEKGVNERTGFFGQVVFRAEQGVDDPAVREEMEAFLRDIEENVDDVQVVSPYAPESAHQIADGGQIAYAEINFSDRSNEQYTDDADIIKDLRDEIDVSGLQVELGGFIFAEEPDFSSELVGIIAAVIILLIAFGSLLAMGLPIITALFGVGTGAALIGLLMRILDVPEFTTAIAAMIGIGVGIDYALLVVTRYRQGLHDGLEPREAVELSLDTSGRAVVFAGLTVVIALLGMYMMNLEFIRSIATSAVLAVFMTMLASITLLPAMLGFVGRNIDRFGLPHKAEAAEQGASRSFWYRWSRVIQGHPWPAFLGSAALLVLLAIPMLSIRLGFGDAGNLPESNSPRRAFDMLAEGFGPGFNGPVLVVVEGNEGEADADSVNELKAAIEGTEGVDSATEPDPVANGVYLFTVFPTSAPQDKETSDLVHRIRDEVAPPIAEDAMIVRLTGDTPFVVDFADYISDRLPLFIGAVLVLSFLLLMTVFQSIVVAAKAVVMNLLSIAAAFGVMVAVFQWGWGDSLIGLGREGPIEAWAPMMLFAIVFGLSMDYEVFLLTRIREEYDRTGDNAGAVADGLAATGRVITAAAAIMICVFGAFVLGEGRDLKMLGFGLAAAIFIDATIVRLVLVPALMELMGNFNWYLPSWLRWLPDLRVEPREAPAPSASRLSPEAGGGGD